tara:strand:- start:1013 stop:1681 length:669 start_codon:yes stop_codon:yes gene_type:complete
MSNNWARRKVISYTPEFRIDVNNPTNGFLGAGVYEKYAHTDSGDISLTGMNQAGGYHIYNDQTIEIIGGGGKNNDRGGKDIIISGMKGSVVISAMQNGDIRINGNNIILEAKQDIVMKAGGNLTADIGRKIDLVAKEAYCDAPHSYGPNAIATETPVSFLADVYTGLAAYDIAKAASDGAGGFGIGGVPSISGIPAVPGVAAIQKKAIDELSGTLKNILKAL